MKTKLNSQGGFMQLIVLAVVVILLLAYFKIDLRAILDKPVVHNFLNIFVVAWGTYIKPLLVYMFSNVIGLFK